MCKYLFGTFISFWYERERESEKEKERKSAFINNGVRMMINNDKQFLFQQQFKMEIIILSDNFSIQKTLFV